MWREDSLELKFLFPTTGAWFQVNENHMSVTRYFHRGQKVSKKQSVIVLFRSAVVEKLNVRQNVVSQQQIDEQVLCQRYIFIFTIADRGPKEKGPDDQFHPDFVSKFTSVGLLRS